ncbi:hypothetical protein ACGFI9_37390 [Micromonospora sp. NPDC048930]
MTDSLRAAAVLAAIVLTCLLLWALTIGALWAVWQLLLILRSLA